MSWAAFRAVVVLGWIVGCGDGSTPPPTEPAMGGTAGTGGAAAIECLTKAPTACAEPSPHYAADIKPIVDSICINCHKGEKDGPWSLAAYEHLADWHDLLRTAMLKCNMPPVDSGYTMTLEQRQTMLNWLRCGFPE